SSMKTLPPCRNFKPSKQEIKPCRCRFRSRMGVERPGGERKPQDKYSGDAVLGFREPAELTLGFGIEVIDEIASPEPFDTLFKCPNRNVEHGRQGRTVFRVQLLENVSEQLAFELDDILWTVNESHLQIERVVLGQMAARGMRFRAIDVSGFKHALQSG